MKLNRRIQQNNKEEVMSFLSKFITFFVIYFNLSSLGVTLNISSVTYIAITIFLSSVIFTYVLLKHKFKLNRSSLLLLIFSIIFITLSMTFNADYNMMNFTIIGLILSAFFLTESIKLNQFIQYYVKIMFFLSVYSLIIMYIIAPNFSFISNLFPMKVNSTGIEIRDYFFGFHMENHIIGKTRNTGIFREMGVYQHYVNLALLFHLYWGRKIRISYVIVFVTTVITTFSTPGIIFLCLILLSYILENRGDIVYLLLLMITGVIIYFLMIRFVPQFFILFERSISKLFGYSNSFDGRVLANINNIHIWSTSPIFGRGINTAVYYQDLDLNILQINHITSTTTSFLAIYGIPFTLMYSCPFIILISRRSITNVSKLLLIVGVFISLNTQRYIYDIFYYFIVFLVVKERLKKEDKRKGDENYENIMDNKYSNT